MAYLKPILLKSKKDIPRGTKIVDGIFETSLEELFVVRNPFFLKKEFKNSSEWKKFMLGMKDGSQWIYFPSKKTAVNVLKEKPYFELRTARNKNLITKEEQQKYRDTTIGIAGLSVGSSILAALAISGGPKVMKVADFDILAPSNMNRIRAAIDDVGTEKIDLAARDVWGIDPYAKLILWNKGITEKSLEKFIFGSPKIDIFIDEMDDLALKVAARLIAKRKKIPVLMATDNGDGIIIDIERFDQDPKRKIFHGLVGDMTVAEVRNLKGPAWIEVVKKIIGEESMPERHRSSLGEIGKTLAGVPQLGTDALLAGSAISLAVRKIANAHDLPSGRRILNLGDYL
jgi:molybdopterin/thiamine biosynthesis adenylyltransferase